MPKIKGKKYTNHVDLTPLKTLWESPGSVSQRPQPALRPGGALLPPPRPGGLWRAGPLRPTEPIRVDRKSRTRCSAPLASAAGGTGPEARSAVGAAAPSPAWAGEAASSRIAGIRRWGLPPGLRASLDGAEAMAEVVSPSPAGLVSSTGQTHAAPVGVTLAAARSRH